MFNISVPVNFYHKNILNLLIIILFHIHQVPKNYYKSYYLLYPFFFFAAQVRRLYDVANVLSSIGLIQKESAFSHCGRKPAFKYIGPDLKAFEGIL